MRAGTPATRAGLAAWRRVPIAILVGLVVLAAGSCPPPPASAHDWHLGYSAADDRNADVAAFEMDPGAVPGLSGAPFFHRPCRFCGQIAADPVPSRSPLPTRDRSPPVR